VTRASLRSALHASLAAGLLAAPRVAQACAVCTGGQKEEVNRAFLVGSLFLSVLPLAAIGALVWWLRRRTRALSAASPALSASPR
jgi:hypothetical protein